MMSSSARWRLLPLVLLMSVAMSILPSCGRKASIYTIGYVQIADNPVLDKARDALFAQLAAEGFSEGTAIRVERQCAQGDLALIPQILQSFIAADVDMVITCGTPCMAAAAQAIHSTPVVFTVAFSLEQLGSTKTPPNMAGTYDPVDMEYFVATIREIAPGASVLGLPYNPAEANSTYAADALAAVCARQGMTVIRAAAASANDVPQAAEAVVQKGAQALVMAADNTVAIAEEAMVRSARQHRIPLFSYDASLVEFGACCGTGVDYAEWGRESGRIAARIIRGEQPSAIGPVPLRNRQLYLNRTAATGQGVSFTDAVLQKATHVFP